MYANVDILTIRASVTQTIILVHIAHHIAKAVSEYHFHRKI